MIFCAMKYVIKSKNVKKMECMDFVYKNNKMYKLPKINF